MHWYLVCVLIIGAVVEANYPSFEPSHRMRILLVPADMRVGSVIYRLRATDPDFDYPLRFDVVDSVGRSIIRIDSLPCTATHTYCQGNVYLTRRLEQDRVYDMILSVRDSTGQETKVDATIKATLATSHFEDVFPYVPSLLMVPEDTLLGSSLGFVLARRSPPIPFQRPDVGRSSVRNTELEMWGSENFRLYQTTGTRDVVNASIKLTAELDFEERTMYMLTIFVLDPWTVEREDTRNIAGFQLPVVVTDVQDMPPVFTVLPPVTTLPNTLKVGDKVLQVHAQDGDRGDSREIRYGLVSEKNPFTTFFNISERTGEIILAKPLKELQMITRSSQPIVLTVMAEEVKLNIQEPPALTATAAVALLLSNKLANSPPKFMNNEYVARLKENAPQGTALVFGASYSAVIEDLDAGQDGVFALGLTRDNGTFEVSPNVAETRAHFVIRVRNNELLDFEKRTSVSFQIMASELGPSASGVNTSCLVTVYLEDENDNIPVFNQARYQAQLPENVTADTMVTQVSATDLDSGIFGRIAYTRILGYLNHSLSIDSATGAILVATNNHGFDREAAAEYRFTVEARDMEGTGNKASVPLTIRLLDVNDETPEFEHQVFEFILQPGLRNFTSRAYVKAIDKDAEPPNNVVRYEIMSGNTDNKFHLNEITGELTVRGSLGRRRDSIKINKSGQRTVKQREPLDESSSKRGVVSELIDEGSQWVEVAKGTEWRGTKSKSQPISNAFDDENYNDDDLASRTSDNNVMDSVIVLNIRAYDLGIPHRWQRAHVRIYPPESRARNMNFIVGGSKPDIRATEELLRALTGGRVTIQDIKPYTGREQGTDLTHNDFYQDKSVVTATVIYDGNSVVDLQQIERRLIANKTQAVVEQSVQEYKSENRVLFWLLIFLIILLIIAALLLLLCCLWQGCLVCPCLEVQRKTVVVSPSDNGHFIAKERALEMQTKGVQAVYSGRKEAWSARPDNRTSYYPNSHVRVERQYEDGHHYTPAAAGGRMRHPTMLIEDVEGQNNWEYDDRQKRNHRIAEYNEHGHNDRSPGTPRFARQYSPQQHRCSPASPRHHRRHSRDNERPRTGDRGSREYIRAVDPSPARNAHLLRLAVDGFTEDDRGHRENNREAYQRQHGVNETHKNIPMEEQDEILYRQDDNQKRITRGLLVGKEKDDEGGGNVGGLSPPPDLLNPDSDSLRRHEMERGSVARDWEGGEEELADRDQLYIRDGNAEILRLLTRGPRDERPHTLVQESGKEILMQRFMEDQGDGQTVGLLREYLTQDYLGRLLYPQLQNIQDTQSLPGHMESSTQTECEAATQTDEPAYLLPSQRNARSDNELSDDEDRPGRWRRGRRANIKTPIMEEGESLVSGESAITQIDTRPAMFPIPQSSQSVSNTAPTYTENKSSILRRRKLKDKDGESSGEEIEAEVQPRPSRNRDRRKQPNTVQIRADSLNRLYRALKDLQTSGSLNELTQSEDEPDKNFLRKAGFFRKIKELSTTTTTESVNSRDGDEVKVGGQQRSKYMDWYKNLSNSKPKKQNVKRKEDDLDSGIALSSLLGSKKSKLEKKSVFTIAYDDIQTKNIRPDTNSSQKL